jgi:type IV secretory pathway VirB3-like protein
LATALIYFGIYDLNDYLFARVYFDLLGGDMRPIGFSSEPSYAAFILALSWMALVRLGFLSQERRKIILNWTICVLVALQLLGSIYGYLLSFIIIATMVKIFPDYRKYTFIASAVTAALLFLGVNFDNGGRFFNILTAIFSGSMDEWRSEDFSSFFRFGPFVIYLRESDFLNYHAWIGYGATSAAYFFGNIFQEHVVSDQMAIELGFIPSYLYDYGLICAIVFLVFLYLISYGDHRFAMVLMLILLLFNANFNTQIIWFAITCSYVSMRKQF